jgi:putative aldouronate transport system substrate-binding protein
MKRNWIAMGMSVAMLSSLCSGVTVSAETTSEEEPITIDLFVAENWFTCKDWTGAVCDAITDATGVKFNVTIATDYNQLPVLVASGDAPEMVFSSVDYNLMSNSDVSYDWGSLIEEYCPEWEIPEETKALYTMSDGKFYTLLNSFSSQEEWEADSIASPATMAGLAINDDIMEELGNPEINTLEDLDAVFAQVKEKYPDVTPLVMNSVWMSMYFAEQMGVNREASFYVNDDGDVQYWIDQPGQLEYYKLINEWYRKGYIMAENYAFNNEDEPLQYAINGKCFAYAYTSRAADTINARVEANGGTTHWSALTTQLTDHPLYNYTWTGWAGTYITKNCKNPEAAIKVMEYLHSDEGQKLSSWGIEGEDYTLSEDGSYPVFLSSRQDYDALAQRGLPNWGLIGGSGVVECLGNYVEGSEFAKTIEAQKPYIYYNPFLGLINPESGTEEYDIQVNIDEMVKVETSKIFLADSEEACEQAYNDMIEIAKGMGLEQLEAYATETYHTAKGE